MNTNDDFDDDVWTDEDEVYLSENNQSEWQPYIHPNSMNWLNDQEHAWQNHAVFSDEDIDPEDEPQVESNHDWVDTTFTDLDDIEINNDDELVWLSDIYQDDDLSINEVENYLFDSKLSQEERAEQIAIQCLLDFEWDKSYLPFLVEVFSQPYYGATKMALYRAVNKNITADTIKIAYEIKQYWQASSHFHLSVACVYEPAIYSKYIWLSWNCAFELLACFDGLPDIEEVYAHLDEWHDQWQRCVKMGQRGADFWNFIRMKIKLPMPYWHFHWENDTDILMDIALDSSIDRPNGWFVAMNHFYADSQYQNTIDTVMQQEEWQHHEEQDEIESTVQAFQQPKVLSVWEQHQRMMFEIACNRPDLKAFEILKFIPLNHNEWSEDARIYFKLNQLDNVYQALQIIKMAQHDFSRHSHQLIKKYIDEVKRQIQASKEDDIKTD